MAASGPSPTSYFFPCPSQLPPPYCMFSHPTPSYDLEDCHGPPQITPASAHHGGRYTTQPGQPSAMDYYFEYAPTHHTAHIPYDPTGYFTTDGQYCLPLGSQLQQNLVSDRSDYLRSGAPLDHYETVTQHPNLPIPSSSFSELGSALVEISSPKPQPMSHASITLPRLPLPSQPAPKHDPSEGAIVNPVKTECGVFHSSQSFSPVTPLDNPSITPYTKDQEQLHVGASLMPRASTPLCSLPESFLMVKDPAAYPAFLTKVRSYLTIGYTCSSIYRATRCHCPSLFLALTHIPLARRRTRRHCRLLIWEHLHRM
jgi:hypothetical protein